VTAVKEEVVDDEKVPEEAAPIVELVAVVPETVPAQEAPQEESHALMEYKPIGFLKVEEPAT
jgi:hypothetical protein